MPLPAPPAVPEHATASASTTAVAGAWTVAGVDGSARHLHAGPPARLGGATFRVTFAGEGPAPLTVTGIEFLSGDSCDTPPAEVRSRPRFGGLFPLDGSLRESVPVLTVAPGTVEVDVGFESVEAYYTWCDRFAFRVRFDAGGQPLAAVAETVVTRVEPRER